MWRWWRCAGAGEDMEGVQEEKAMKRIDTVYKCKLCGATCSGFSWGTEPPGKTMPCWNCETLDTAELEEPKSRRPPCSI